MLFPDVSKTCVFDGSVQTEDLSDDVKGQIQKTYDQSNESMSMNFDER